MKNKVNRILAHDPVVESVLSDKNKLTSEAELFIVTGRSHAKLAMVRLFESDRSDGFPAGNWYQLGYKIKAVKHKPQLLRPLYADLSRLIIKDRSVIITLLNDYPERLAGTIHKRDMEQIIEAISGAATISKDIKNKYFDFF